MQDARSCINASYNELSQEFFQPAVVFQNRSSLLTSLGALNASPLTLLFPYTLKMKYKCNPSQLLSSFPSCPGYSPQQLFSPQCQNYNLFYISAKESNNHSSFLTQLGALH